jgi:hypothetical protein
MPVNAREGRMLDRTQEVVGSSPTSSMEEKPANEAVAQSLGAGLFYRLRAGGCGRRGFGSLCRAGRSAAALIRRPRLARSLSSRERGRLARV